MEKCYDEKAEANNKSKLAGLWYCRNALYDSFELHSFKPQLDSALVCTSLSMPHFTDHRAPPQSKPKKPSKIFLSLGKLIRSVLRTRPKYNSASSVFKLLQDGSNKDESFYVVYDTSGALTTIPEVSEIDLGGLSSEIASLVRRTSSEPTSLDISRA